MMKRSLSNLLEPRHLCEGFLKRIDASTRPQAPERGLSRPQQLPHNPEFPGIRGASSARKLLRPGNAALGGGVKMLPRFARAQFPLARPAASCNALPESIS